MAELVSETRVDFLKPDYTHFSGTLEEEKKEVWKSAAVKEAVIRLRSGSGSAYWWLVCECVFVHACMSMCVIFVCFYAKGQ